MINWFSFLKQLYASQHTWTNSSYRSPLGPPKTAANWGVNTNGLVSLFTPNLDLKLPVQGWIGKKITPKCQQYCWGKKLIKHQNTDHHITYPRNDQNQCETIYHPLSAWYWTDVDRPHPTRTWQRSNRRNWQWSVFPFRRKLDIYSNTLARVHVTNLILKRRNKEGTKKEQRRNKEGTRRE